MRRAAAAFLAAAVLAGATGCGTSAGEKEFAPSENSVYISKEGTVSSAFVESYDKDYYTADSLKAYLEATIAGQYPDVAVTVKECSVENGVMKAVFDYGTPEDLMTFLADQKSEGLELESFQVETVAAGRAAGTVAAGGFVNASDGKPADFKELARTEGQLVEVKGQAAVQTEGKILYVSDGVEVTDSGAVVSGGPAYIIFK